MVSLWWWTTSSARAGALPDGPTTTASGAIRSTLSACLAGITMSLRPQTTSIGIAYAAQEIDTVPDEPHDRRLDWIVTERETIRRSAVVIFASDRGLAGAFNSQILREGLQLGELETGQSGALRGGGFRSLFGGGGFCHEGSF